METILTIFICSFILSFLLVIVFLIYALTQSEDYEAKIKLIDAYNDGKKMKKVEIVYYLFPVVNVVLLISFLYMFAQSYERLESKIAKQSINK